MPFFNSVLIFLLSCFLSCLQTTKSDVDASPTFPSVLAQFERWLEKHSLLGKTNWAFVTDGPWDIRDFVRKQCDLSKITRPKYFNRWVNLRQMFHDFYKTSKRLGLAGMLGELGMTFEGREHSGICDSRNIARIFVRMVQDGCLMKTNSKLD